MKRATLIATIGGAVALVAIVALVLALGSGQEPSAVEAAGTVQEGPANAVLVSSPQVFKVRSKATFDANRVVIGVAKPTTAQKVLRAEFTCQSNGLQLLSTSPKGNVGGKELWSMTFFSKCITAGGGGVTVRLTPFDPNNKLQITQASVENTNVMPPLQGPANAVFIGHGEFIYTVTSKATFTANRIVVEVGKSDQNQKVSFAVAALCSGDPFAGATTALKGRGTNPSGGTPKVEIWSFTFSSKCLPPGGTAQVRLTAVDPMNQLVIKRAFVQNVQPKTPTPTPTPTFTPAPTQTKPPPNGNCTAGPQNVMLQGNVWDQWKCTPTLTVLFNRIDISVGKADQNFKLDPTHPPRFVCQLTREKVIGVFKTHKKDANPPPSLLPNHEIWSGEFKRDCNSVDVYLKPRLATNHPVIKEVSFSTVAPPPKLPSPGDSDGDGCSDVRENGADETMGGRRNYRNPFDFYDVDGNRIVTLFGDIFAVSNAFNTMKGGAGYSANLDRSSPLPGEDMWDTHKPDGIVTLFGDIFSVTQQFNHNCN